MLQKVIEVVLYNGTIEKFKSHIKGTTDRHKTNQLCISTRILRMNKQDLRTIFGIIIILALILGSIVIVDQTQAGATKNPEAQLEKIK